MTQETTITTSLTTNTTQSLFMMIYLQPDAFFQNCYNHNYGDYIILRQNSTQHFQNWTWLNSIKIQHQIIKLHTVQLDQNSTQNFQNYTWSNWIKIQHQIIKITHSSTGSKFYTNFSKFNVLLWWSKYAPATCGFASVTI